MIFSIVKKTKNRQTSLLRIIALKYFYKQIFIFNKKLKKETIQKIQFNHYRVQPTLNSRNKRSFFKLIVAKIKQAGIFKRSLVPRIYCFRKK